MKKATKHTIVPAILVSLLVAIVGYQALHSSRATVITDSILYDSNRSGNFEIYKMLKTGSVTRLTADAAYDSWWAKSSPNGAQVLFYRTPAGVHDTDYTKTSLWMMNVDGSNQRQILANGAYGWGVQGHAEWSPDGTKLVMFGGSSIVITDTNGVVQKSLPPGLDPVWSSDGTRILYVACSEGGISCDASGYRIFSMNVDGTNQRLLETLPYRANDPTMSPDGSIIAWETNISGLVWDIYTMNTDGSNPRAILSDGNINSVPVWSSSGKIYVHKTAPSVHDSFGIWAMNADGTNLTWVTQGQPGSNEYPDVIQANRIGDTNNDGIVNIYDLSTLATNWGRSGMTSAQGDFSGDGVVGIADLSILATTWG